MNRVLTLLAVLFLSACTGPGWDHSPMSYSSLLSDNLKLEEPISIKIIDTDKEASQSMAYVGGGLLIGRQWSYEQLEILTRLSKDTEAYLNDGAEKNPDTRVLLVSGNMKNDYRGNYIATLRASLVLNGDQVGIYESEGIVKSHIASPIAFENAFKVAFDNLASGLQPPNKASH